MMAELQQMWCQAASGITKATATRTFAESCFTVCEAIEGC
jgi:hypothetical protein